MRYRVVDLGLIGVLSRGNWAPIFDRPNPNNLDLVVKLVTNHHLIFDWPFSAAICNSIIDLIGEFFFYGV